jgi:hypothetical protein
MAAGAEKAVNKFVQHEIPPENAKEPPPATASAVRKVALRLRPDIDDGLCPAGPAVDRQVPGTQLRVEPQDPRAPAHGTVEPSVICLNYTTFRFNYQHLSTAPFVLFQLINTTPSQILYIQFSKSGSMAMIYEKRP